MKVVEKDTDRKAEIHICKRQHQGPGRFGGKFTGTTLTVVHDAIVDGVLRKSSWTVAKNVRLQTNKKLDTERFLFRADDGIIDSEMTVAPLSGVTSAQAEMQETIGTMELRLYVTRQLSVFHAVENNKNYYVSSEEITGNGSENFVHYKRIPPTFQLDIEKNSAPLGKPADNGHRKKMNQSRPGKEPWGIFRFHYRSKEALDEHRLICTYDPLSKEITEPRVLSLEPVPRLEVGAKPPKDEEDTSTRSSSPFPPATPCAPAKSVDRSRKSSTPAKIPLDPKASLTATKMSSTMEQSVSTFPGKITESNSGNPTSPTPREGNTEEGFQVKTSAKPAAQPPVLHPAAADIAKGLNAERLDGNKFSSMVNWPAISNVFKDGTNGSAEYEERKVVSIPGNEATVTYSTQKETPAPAKEIIQMPAQPKATQTKKPGSKPTYPSTGATNLSPNTAMLSSAATSNKRPSPSTNDTPIEPKRQRVGPASILPSIQPLVPPIISRSPTPKTASIEIKLVTQRKKLEEMRKKRQETAKKQAAIDEQMAPYKQRMAEELERLNKEMMDEESAFIEESQHLHISVAILKDFKKDEDGN
ncbi:hypothetical protein DDE83_000723 [Stemphylium lycopersici]|uniref:Uncharacterized protein n=1 Tax=Stemphylium lycopersici TaxID=183478 RepID=A0A364NF82_STELY|nr:hypothetical protein DDE83_000723 [Stemphylium lycopersici]